MLRGVTQGVSGRRQTDASERSVSGRRHTDERRSMGRRQQTEQSIAPSVLTSDTGGDARAGRGANRFCSPVFCGVLIVCFLFFAPLVGLFFMQHGGMSATEHEATTGPYFCRDMPPLAVRNRSSGLPVRACARACVLRACAPSRAPGVAALVCGLAWLPTAWRPPGRGARRPACTRCEPLPLAARACACAHARRSASPIWPQTRRTGARTGALRLSGRMGTRRPP